MTDDVTHPAQDALPVPAAGLSIKGSQRQLQLHINAPELCYEIEEQVYRAAPSIERGSLRWKSPLLSECYREYFDAGFLTALGRPELADDLARFWPRRGPVWDGLATLKTTDGETGALLVEAKAHKQELLRGGSLGKGVSAPSRAIIQERLAETRANLEVEAEAPGWLVDRYQTANRLAHASWLRCHVPAALMVHVLFHDDPTHISESKAVLLDAAAAVYEGLGFTSGGPDFALTITCPGADPLSLEPGEIPSWARHHVELDGLQLEPGSYPSATTEGARAEEPHWALIGELGRENDEIAVAAFPAWLEFSSLTLWWDGHTPVPAVKPLQRVCWQELPSNAETSLAAVGLLARAVERRRRQSYRQCADCNEWTAPEHRDRVEGRYVCRGCQERYHGVVD